MPRWCGTIRVRNMGRQKLDTIQVMFTGHFISSTNFYSASIHIKGFPCGSAVKNSPAGEVVQSLGQEDPRKRAWLPTPVFLPGKSHGQRSLEGYLPWGCRVRHNWATSTHTIQIKLPMQMIFWKLQKYFLQVTRHDTLFSINWTFLWRFNRFISGSCFAWLPTTAIVHWTVS